jgi:hypothetical protein
METDIISLLPEQEIADKIGSADINEDLKRKFSVGLTGINEYSDLTDQGFRLSKLVFAICIVIHKSNDSVLTKEEFRSQFKVCIESIVSDRQTQDEAMSELENVLSRITS